MTLLNVQYNPVNIQSLGAPSLTKGKVQKLL